MVFNVGDDLLHNCEIKKTEKCRFSSLFVKVILLDVIIARERIIQIVVSLQRSDHFPFVKHGSLIVCRFF